jgi:hypothetical protein
MTWRFCWMNVHNQSWNFWFINLLSHYQRFNINNCEPQSNIIILHWCLMMVFYLYLTLYIRIEHFSLTILFIWLKIPYLFSSSILIKESVFKKWLVKWESETAEKLEDDLFSTMFVELAEKKKHASTVWDEFKREVESKITWNL